MTLITLGRGVGRGGVRGRGGRNKPPRYSNQMQSANNQFSQNMMYSQNSQVCILTITTFVACIVSSFIGVCMKSSFVVYRMAANPMVVKDH